MSKVYGYLRVSTHRQDTNNQLLEIQNYCDRNGLTLDDTIEMTISSRKNMKDRHIDELLSMLKRNDTLIVSELSRLGRSIRELSVIVEELRRKNVTFIAIKQGFKFNGKLDMTQKISLAMFSVFAELERDLLSERTKNGLARARAEGKVLGNPDLEIDNTVRFDNARAFAEKHRTLFEGLIGQGLTQRGICDELNELGIKTRSGGRWQLAQVQRIIKRLGLKTVSSK